MKHTFTAKLWIYPGGTAAWHFITVPKILSGTLKKKYGKNARGWGSLPVKVTVGKTIWQTSIFPDSKSGTYLLPMKALIRKAEGLDAGDSVEVSIIVR